MRSLTRPLLPRAFLGQYVCAGAVSMCIARFHATPLMGRRPAPKPRPIKTLANPEFEPEPAETGRREASNPPRRERTEKSIFKSFLKLVLSTAIRISEIKTIKWAGLESGILDLGREHKLFAQTIREAFAKADEGLTSKSVNPLFFNLRKAFAEDDLRGLSYEIKYLFNAHLLRHHTTREIVTSQKRLTDFQYPHEWYPATRALQRTVHVHVGPTNSGKTHNAIKALEKAKTGIYAGPLRLLAHEIYSRLTAKGRPCALVTGEEVRIPEDADIYYTSCTVEMTPLNRVVDVAIIDEIQLLGDPERGPMWTTAFLGVQAKEVHVCGEERAVPIIKSLCASTGDTCIIHKYERLSPLKTMGSALEGWKNLQKGDAVVAFSRVLIHQIKRAIEVETGRRCAVVYGSLPPEVRAQQAALFNNPDNEYDFLVASDAIGMGLNLEVKRIIFESTSKNIGLSAQPLSVSDIRQIGGRAGRYRSARAHMEGNASGSAVMAGTQSAQALIKTGYVTTLDKTDLQSVHDAFTTEVEPIEKCMLQAPASVLEAIASHYPPNTPLSFILHRIRDLATVSSRFKLKIKMDMIDIADAIQEFPMSIYDRVLLLNSPASLSRKDPTGLQVLKAVARAISSRRGGGLLEMPEFKLDHLDVVPRPGKEQDYLHVLELLDRSMTLYLWVSYRFTSIFPSQELAFVAREAVHERINVMLDRIRHDKSAMTRQREARRALAEREEQMRQERERLLWKDQQPSEEEGAGKEKSDETVEALGHSQIADDGIMEPVTDIPGDAPIRGSRRDRASFTPVIPTDVKVNMEGKGANL